MRSHSGNDGLWAPVAQVLHVLSANQPRWWGPKATLAVSGACLTGAALACRITADMLIGLVDTTVQSLARRPLGPQEDEVAQQELLPPILPVLHPYCWCSQPMLNEGCCRALTCC